MGLSDTHQIGRIVIHPDDADVVYVAALGHLYSDNAERGVFKTTDGGTTWTHVLEVINGDRHVSVVDLVMSRQDPGGLYAAAYDRAATPWMFRQGGPAGGIYKTTDGGATWAKLDNGLPSGDVGRIGLTISLQNPEVLYSSILLPGDDLPTGRRRGNVATDQLRAARRRLLFRPDTRRSQRYGARLPARLRQSAFRRRRPHLEPRLPLGRR